MDGSYYLIVFTDLEQEEQLLEQVTSIDEVLEICRKQLQALKHGEAIQIIRADFDYYEE